MILAAVIVGGILLVLLGIGLRRLGKAMQEESQASGPEREYRTDGASGWGHSGPRQEYPSGKNGWSHRASERQEQIQAWQTSHPDQWFTSTTVYKPEEGSTVFVVDEDHAPRMEPDMQTITVHRKDQDITVAVRVRGPFVAFLDVLDEQGRTVNLTTSEAAQVKAEAMAGHDETGR